jgi:hypothetical protein
MNIFRVVKDADVLDVASQSAADETLIPKRESWLSERKRTRRERDAERGYSINIKQVVLAFAVEFWIIGLIVVGTYQLIDDSGKLSQKEVFSALLLPAALARCGLVVGRMPSRSVAAQSLRRATVAALKESVVVAYSANHLVKFITSQRTRRSSKLPRQNQNWRMVQLRLMI